MKKADLMFWVLRSLNWFTSMKKIPTVFEELEPWSQVAILYIRELTIHVNKLFEWTVYHSVCIFL